MKILVTGATGNIGFDLCQFLGERDHQVLAGVRTSNISKTKFESKNVQVVSFDFYEVNQMQVALSKTEVVFFLRPPQMEKPEDFKLFLKLCKVHEVKFIVFLSLMGIEKNPIPPHYKIEKMVREIGIPFCFIRPGFFMQNLSTTHAADIRDQDDLFIPGKRSKTSFIDTRDIALAIANVIENYSEHLNTAYTLTGGEAVTYQAVAETASKVLGRKITYSNPGLLKFRRTMIERGTPKEFANVMVFLYVMTILGTAKPVTRDLEQLIGRKPTTIEEFFCRNKSIWEKETS